MSCYSLVCNKPAVAVATPVNQFVCYEITLELLRATHASASPIVRHYLGTLQQVIL